METTLYRGLSKEVYTFNTQNVTFHSVHKDNKWFDIMDVFAGGINRISNRNAYLSLFNSCIKNYKKDQTLTNIEVEWEDNTIISGNLLELTSYCICYYGIINEENKYLLQFLEFLKDNGLKISQDFYDTQIKECSNFWKTEADANERKRWEQYYNLVTPRSIKFRNKILNTILNFWNKILSINFDWKWVVIIIFVIVASLADFINKKRKTKGKDKEVTIKKEKKKQKIKK